MLVYNLKEWVKEIKSCVLPYFQLQGALSSIWISLQIPVIYLLTGHFHRDVLQEPQTPRGLISLFCFPVLTHVSQKRKPEAGVTCQCSVAGCKPRGARARRLGKQVRDSGEHIPVDVLSSYPWVQNTFQLMLNVTRHFPGGSMKLQHLVIVQGREDKRKIYLFILQIFPFPIFL